MESFEETFALDEFGMWIVGNQLFMGYGLIHTIEEVIVTCRQSAQYIHVTQELESTAQLLEFAKNLNSKLIKIKSGCLGVSKDVLDKKLRLLLLRSLDRMNEISPLLVSSIEAYITTGSTVGKSLALQNREYFKLKLLEIIRDLVLQLQMVKNNKQVPEPLHYLKADNLNVAVNWLDDSEEIASSLGLEAIRVCIQEGRRLSSLLAAGTDKGELLALSSEADKSYSIIRDTCKEGKTRSTEFRTECRHLTQLLRNLKERMIEALSRKLLDDFVEPDAAVVELEKAALIPHFKPQRDMVFSEKNLRFEQHCNNLAANIDLTCHLRMIPSLHKCDTVTLTLNQMVGLSRQVLCAAKLLFNNPYSEVLKDHFTLIKHSWLRKVEQLRSIIMSAADLRTYSTHVDNRSYITRSVISPVRQVKFSPSAPPDVREPSPSKIIAREQPTWENADKDLVQAARKLALIMCKLVYLVRNKGCTKSELLGSAKDIVRACDIVSRLIRELAVECSDKDTQKALMKFCERIPTFATQLKMVCTVKASTTGPQSGCEEDEQATEMLLENARNLMSSVRDVVHTAGAASIHIRIAANQYIW